MKQIYFDYAAATPVDDLALKAMAPFLQDRFYNPSAVYQAAREVRGALEAARKTVASVLGAKSQEIIFTAGGTEANNLAIHGILSQFDDPHVVTSSIEHESVLEPVKSYPHTIVGVSHGGIVNLSELETAITDKTVLVSVMYANNEVGTIQPLKKIANIIEQTRLKRQQQGNICPLWLHSDGAQAANYLNLHVSRLGIDLLTLNGGKLYAMKQSGCLYLKTGVALKPLFEGGGQEAKLRSGTESIVGIISFATMLQEVQRTRIDESKRLTQIRDQITATLSQNLHNININGDVHYRLPNNLNITIPGADGERLLMELDEAGLALATGSACTASSDEPSHVLQAMGLSRDAASASLRLTLGRPTTATEAERAISIMTRIITRHYRLV